MKTYWDYLVLPISIPGVRKVLKSQEGFLILIFFLTFSMFPKILWGLATFLLTHIWSVQVGTIVASWSPS